MLDVAGIFLEPADLLNAAISLCRGNWEEAALSLVCAFPLIGKSGKGIKRALSAGTETVLKTAKTGESVSYTRRIGNAADGLDGLSQGATVDLWQRSLERIQ